MIAMLLAGLVLAAEPADPAATHGATGLAAAPPAARGGAGVAMPLDTLARIPGSTIRLGWTPERAHSLGALKPAGAAGDVSTHETDVRWFGAPAKSRLRFREGKLFEAQLSATGTSRRFGDYFYDELRRQGYRRVSHVVGEGSDRSEWRGRAVIKVAAGGGNLTVDVSALPQREPVAPVATAPAAAAAPPIAATPPVAAPAGGPPLANRGSEIDFTAPRVADSLPAPRRTFVPPDPPRPRIAVEAGVFGRVQVRASVDEAGKVVHAEIARGIPELNQAALGWASEVKFEPYVVQGRPAPFAILIPVTFATRSPTP